MCIRDRSQAAAVAGQDGLSEAGKLANFIVVDEDPLETPAERLSEITVNAVFFDGQMIHGSLESGGRDGKSL